MSQILGYNCVRINNHEHTEIEEYIGTYMPDVTGKLVFKEGVMVEAIRNGIYLHSSKYYHFYYHIYYYLYLLLYNNFII